jgi:kumamolisin
MADRRMFADSIVPLPDSFGRTAQGLMVNAAGSEHRKEAMTVLFSLGLPQARQAELEARVAAGEVVTEAEMKAKYSLGKDERKALVSWLKGRGFRIEHVSEDGTSIYAHATVEQIASSLAVNMVRVTKDGITYNAAQNAPSLPSEVAGNVQAIIGLQPFRRANKHSLQCLPLHDNRAFLSAAAPSDRKRRSRATAARRTAKAAASPPAKNVRNAPPYLVSEILAAYGGLDLPVTGKGQTIAILIDSFPSDSDLRAFWKRNGIKRATSTIQKINVNGGPLPPPEGEETLDAEWASGIAPGAQVRIYASGSLAFVDLDKALDRIVADAASEPGMRQLSISLGLGETYMDGPAGEVRVQHAKYLRLAAVGINVFVSSGDAGSNPDASGQSSTGPTQAEYGASDSAVIGVGGTTLKLTPGGSVAAETAWPSSGGGQSIFFDRPIWQKGAGVPSGNQRLVPDVSLAADPNTGALLILNGRVVQIGGTSWSAPVWAGICALLNEARQKAGKALLPFLNPLLYPLNGTPCFRDIQSGSNGAFSAGPGYDMVTGMGVPNVGELLKALA